MEYIEISAKTVDDAVTEAVIQLGTTHDQLEYEVIEKGSAGFIGIGRKDAVIRVKKKDSLEDRIRDFLKKIFSAMQLEVEILIEREEFRQSRKCRIKGSRYGRFDRKERSDA